MSIPKFAADRDLPQHLEPPREVLNDLRKRGFTVPEDGLIKIEKLAYVNGSSAFITEFPGLVAIIGTRGKEGAVSPSETVDGAAWEF